MSTRGNRHQALSMDYPKKGGHGSGTNNALIYGPPWMSKPPAGKRPPYQNGSSNQCWSRKNGPIHVLTLAPEEEYKLFPQPAPSPSPLLQRFLSEVPKVWAEKKNPMGLTRHGAPVLVQLKAGAPQPELGNT